MYTQRKCAFVSACSCVCNKPLGILYDRMLNVFGYFFSLALVWFALLNRQIKAQHFLPGLSLFEGSRLYIAYTSLFKYLL